MASSWACVVHRSVVSSDFVP